MLFLVITCVGRVLPLDSLVIFSKCLLLNFFDESRVYFDTITPKSILQEGISVIDLYQATPNVQFFQVRQAHLSSDFLGAQPQLIISHSKDLKMWEEVSM